MKKIWLLGGIVFGVLAYQIYDGFIHYQRAKCLFYRYGQCVTCNDDMPFPVGYKEACACDNRKGYYIEEGLLPAWQCLVNKGEEIPELPAVKLSSRSCPPHHPLRDVFGNCYSCLVDLPVKISDITKTYVCGHKRYVLPDQLLLKSMKCPDLDQIQDAEVCVSCGGIVDGAGCVRQGMNNFCSNSTECPDGQWCYPFKTDQNGHRGVCALIREHQWVCSGTDGYNLLRAEEFCSRQQAHVPTLDEIESADEDLSILCPTLDMWVFFKPDGVVWLESFTQEFLFTREGESQNLGGDKFYALCHKD